MKNNLLLQCALRTGSVLALGFLLVYPRSEAQSHEEPPDLVGVIEPEVDAFDRSEGDEGVGRTEQHNLCHMPLDEWENLPDNLPWFLVSNQSTHDELENLPGNLTEFPVSDQSTHYEPENFPGNLAEFTVSNHSTHCEMENLPDNLTEFLVPAPENLPCSLLILAPITAILWGDSAEYTFAGQQGYRVEIKVIGQSPGLDPRIWLIDPEEQEVAFDDDSGGNGASLIAITLNQTGSYTIRVKSHGDRAGKFKLSLKMCLPHSGVFN